MTTHNYDNQSSQDERREVLKDTYLNRAAADADLASSGRFKRETATRVTAVPVYPSLPESSPWAHGFDTNVEPVLGFAVDEMPANEIQTPALKSPEVSALPAVEDHAGEPVASVVSPLSAQATGSRSMKRRSLVNLKGPSNDP